MSIDLAQHIAQSASGVDQNLTSASQIVALLAEHRLLDADLDSVIAGEGHNVTASAHLIADVASECVSQAFSLWAHRMVLEYLARGERSPKTDALLDDLRTGRRIGSTAMAAGLKNLAGLSELDITATRTREGYVLNGVIAWASNLVDEGIFVFPARTEDGNTIVGWAETQSTGVNIKPVTGLLALDATSSGFVKLSDVPVPADQIISTDLADFARGFRPTFLVLQTAFCVGLLRRSAEEAAALLGREENQAFQDDIAQLQVETEQLTQTWEKLAADVTQAGPAAFLQLRLDAATLAGRATRLETTLAGGRGYLTSSGASRRFREAAFLPVQSPSEGQLRWELASLVA